VILEDDESDTPDRKAAAVLFQSYLQRQYIQAKMKRFTINFLTLAFFPYICSAAPSAPFDPLCNTGFSIASGITAHGAAGTNNNFTVPFDGQFHDITDGKLPSPV
jgi:hypothetical protein